MTARAIQPNEFIRRQVFGMTQVEMAGMLDISQSRWCRYEAGYRLPEWHKETLRKAAAERGLALREKWFAAAPCEAV